MLFARLGRWVARRPFPIVLGWLALIILLRVAAPNWNDVAHDGDFAYLPETMTSVRGDKLLREAFPQTKARSQVVVIVSRADGPIANEDVFVAYDAARRMKKLLAASLLRQYEEAQANSEALDAAKLDELLEDALKASDDAVFLDDELYANIEDRGGPGPEALPELFAIRARALVAAGELEDAKAFQETADELRGASATPSPTHTSQTIQLPLVDAWTWREPLIGKKLISEDKSARLVVLHLSTELLATRNMGVLAAIEQEVEAVRRFAEARKIEGLSIDLSGSAAVGGDLLRSSKAMVSNTELFSALLVLFILAVVYRTPLLVAVPLISIVTALLVSTSIVAMLTQVQTFSGWEWFDVKIFTTTRIFVTVILFGAGTDYCLFLISRFKEEFAAEQDASQAIERTLSGVGEALTASALTTIVGLATMAFSDFGKYRHSGPVIGFCLAIALLVCVTLTPAILRLMGASVFWPWDCAASPRSEEAPPGGGKAPTGYSALRE